MYPQALVTLSGAVRTAAATSQTRNKN